MQFQIGDRVVHPVYGVGTVKTLTEQQFGGGKTRHYFEVATEGPTVWVPIDEDGRTVMRGVASRQALKECRQLLTSDPMPLEKNRQMRQLEIADRLKAGMLPALCEMLRDLRARSSRAPLGASEDRLLRRITKAVSEEWAVAEGISPASAMREIDGLLEQGSGAQRPKEKI